jgi:hypothetical protein
VPAAPGTGCTRDDVCLADRRACPSFSRSSFRGRPVNRTAFSLVVGAVALFPSTRARRLRRYCRDSVHADARPSVRAIGSSGDEGSESNCVNQEASLRNHPCPAPCSVGLPKNTWLVATVTDRTQRSAKRWQGGGSLEMEAEVSKIFNVIVTLDVCHTAALVRGAQHPMTWHGLAVMQTGRARPA